MASPMEAINASAATHYPTVHATIASAQTGLMSRVLESVSFFRVFFTLFAIAVVYDQSMWQHPTTPRREDH